MSPTQSKGRERRSSQTGLNPLFLTTLVRTVLVRAAVLASDRFEEEEEEEAVGWGRGDDGVCVREEGCASDGKTETEELSGEYGERAQSGT